jgi:uncharacterized protein (DUF433 family)
MKDGMQQIEPKLGEGIYLVKDVAKILRLDYAKTRRWIVGYWSGSLEENTRYVFGEPGNRAINFLSLIEFYTFFKLREKGVSATQVRRLHHHLSNLLGTQYPFATSPDFYIEVRKKKVVYYEYLNNLMRFDKRYQFSLRLIEGFLEKIEFDGHNLAVKFFPLAGSKNIVVDPKHQFGQPIVSGTNIKTQTLYGLYKGGESLEDISALYDISLDKVQDAIAFQKAA